MADIRFGTDGWRAVIGEDFTFRNLHRVAHATAEWVLAQSPAAPKVVVGYDTRFLGRSFAEYAARVLASAGIEVLLPESFVPTPAVSWATREFGCAAGIVITASHNPPEYNGFKLKADFGGPLLPDGIAEVEARIPADDDILPAPKPLDMLRRSGGIIAQDFTTGYLDCLRSRLDIKAIRASGLRVAHDAMFGAGQGVFTELLGAGQVAALRSTHNPGFGGQPPEPIECNLEMLSEAVVAEGCAAGIANDGDADRVALFDERGRFVDSHTLLALLVRYLHKDLGMSGRVVKAFSSTSIIDRMAEAYGLPVETTRIGFKYIAGHIVKGDVLLGGEESGGIAAQGHIPDRDGLYIGLLVMQMMAQRGKQLSELVAELHDEFGAQAYRRIDFRTTDAKKAGILERLRKGDGPEAIAGSAVLRVDPFDGFKHHVEGGWLLVRPSGTEPLLRVYAEAETPERAHALILDAADQLGLPVPQEG
ncbi:MAG: phosphoglucomutase/phosphomannomutase family protein [Bacteroidetes bacterium SB0662_bin_6]|nr:phosphoglucomutase/phosphomannomutase family protein [Bacteroidetes bacterium SB0668_bin_1]MYE04299.1 phosphoglucomutase/phosphomannomutase family protein [Bacteroidetes bacterium SB0662_bin_6]